MKTTTTLLSDKETSECTIKLEHFEVMELRRELNDILSIINNSKLGAHIDTRYIQGISSELTRSLDSLEILKVNKDYWD